MFKINTYIKCFVANKISPTLSETNYLSLKSLYMNLKNVNKKNCSYSLLFYLLLKSSHICTKLSS